MITYTRKVILAWKQAAPFTNLFLPHTAPEPVHLSLRAVLHIEHLDTSTCPICSSNSMCPKPTLSFLLKWNRTHWFCQQENSFIKGKLKPFEIKMGAQGSKLLQDLPGDSKELLRTSTINSSEHRWKISGIAYRL